MIVIIIILFCISITALILAILAFHKQTKGEKYISTSNTTAAPSPHINCDFTAKSNPKWIGGFKPSSLTQIKFTGNMDNIDKLQRQIEIKWPEFSWLTIPGENTQQKKTRVFSMFAPFISRAGYSEKGQIYSIICPQQGICNTIFGCLNVEVSVTGVRGWADEKICQYAADLTVEAKIWFSPSALCQHCKGKKTGCYSLKNAGNSPISTSPPKMVPIPPPPNKSWTKQTCEGTNVKIINNIWCGPLVGSGDVCKLTNWFWKMFSTNGLPFPSSKDNAIIIPTQQNTPLPYISVGQGVTKKFKSPSFARHEEEAYTVNNLEVELGAIKKIKTGNILKDSIVNLFNQLIVDIFNKGSGNMLKKGGILAWNLWASAPSDVDQQEWQNHADYWRKSIDADHGSPPGSCGDVECASIPRYFDGTDFQANLSEQKTLLNAFLTHPHFQTFLSTIQ